MKGGWVDTDFSEAFTHMELDVPQGGRSEGAARSCTATSRGTSATRRSRARRSRSTCVAKGKVAAMTKAASYLIWDVRILAGSATTCSRTWCGWRRTRPASRRRCAKKAGFTQITYGTFKGAVPRGGQPDVDEQMVEDVGDAARAGSCRSATATRTREKHVHLMITAARAEPPSRMKPRRDRSSRVVARRRSSVDRAMPTIRCLPRTTDRDERPTSRARRRASEARDRRRDPSRRARAVADAPPAVGGARAAHAAAARSRTTARAGSRRPRTPSPAAGTGGSRRAPARCTSGCRRTTIARPPAPSSTCTATGPTPTARGAITSSRGSSARAGRTRCSSCPTRRRATTST